MPGTGPIIGVEIAIQALGQVVKVQGPFFKFIFHLFFKTLGGGAE
jgi:hypothetical protein